MTPSLTPMLAFLLAALLAVPQPSSAQATDTTAPARGVRLPLDSVAPRREPAYSSAALAAMVEQASRRNRRVPPALLGYRGRVESEIALVLRRAEGQEVTASLEQTSNAVRWRRSGEYEQRVVGYRSTQVAVAPSIVGTARSAWTVPTLYGNRLLLLFGADSARRSRRDSLRIARAGGDTARAARRRVYLAEHPLGEQRDRFYTFSGGDTVARVVLLGRAIDVVRVKVEPRGDFPRRVVVFRGEIDLDARRLHLVRMRGYFDEVGPPLPGLRTRLVARSTEAVAFVELVNQEVNGTWWLPSWQRFEPQVAFPQLGDSRSVLRIVSRWNDVEVDAPDAASYLAALARGDTATRDPALAEDSTGDTLAVRAHRLSFAPRDSIDRFAAWRAELGAESGAVRADDFDDVAPDRWRPTGAPRLDFRVSRASDLVRYNRVEGVFTGYGAELKLRDAAPGVVARATAGWAWEERTMRGRAELDRTRGRGTMGVRGGRQVELTNDFRAALDSGSSFAALLGDDAYDYVDRSGVAVYGARRLTRGTAHPVVLRGELARVRDAGMRKVSLESPFGLAPDTGFRDNRGVLEGRYTRATVQLELDPDMAAQSMRAGVGALAHVERGMGDLDYTRVEARVLARRTWEVAGGHSTLMLRGDAGALYGDVLPPQQLFELGGRGAVLPGYEYKEFAGDRAMLGRAMVMHTLPIWRKPIRITRGFALPGLQPGFSVGGQAGWTGIGDRASARRALLGLAADGGAAGWSPSRATDGVKATVDLRLRFFGGNASLGAAKALEDGRGWRFVAGLVQEL